MTESVNANSNMNQKIKVSKVYQRMYSKSYQWKKDKFDTRKGTEAALTIFLFVVYIYSLKIINRKYTIVFSRSGLYITLLWTFFVVNMVLILARKNNINLSFPTGQYHTIVTT